jgi:signal transduction histidine kinase/CheY-like chemotaxis protein
MSATPNKAFIKPIFDAISMRISRNLSADYFALIIVEQPNDHCSIYMAKRITDGLTQDLEKKLGQIFPDFWRNIDKSQTSISGVGVCDDAGNPIVATFRDTLKCEKVLIAPFNIEDIGRGILTWCWSNTPADYSPLYLEKAALIADHAALSLKLSLKERRAQELNAKLAALLELSTAIYSSLNYTEVLEKAVHLSKDIVGADGGSLFILDKKTNILRPLITVDAKHEKEISKITLRPGEGLTGLVAKTGTGLISNHSESDPRAIQVPGTPSVPESIISAPLTWSGEVIGVITLRSEKCKDFQQEDLDILTIFARHTADAIENAKLYESLDKAYKELASTQEQLIMIEKLRALGEMTGGVAHDFNNVLGTILGRTQLLLREVNDPKLISHLKEIEQMTLAGAKTIQRMQNFTRVASGGRYEQIDLIKVVEDAIESTRPRWKDQCQREGIAIDLHFDHSDRLFILGNPSELVEAFSNLIMNSVDALSASGSISISAVIDNNRAILRFQDNGVGMDEATLKRIFFPFFTTKGRQGTGMGLSVVYGIINRHKGEIDVTSKVGQGTVFTIMFPISDKVDQKIAMPIKIGEIATARILLIDDNDNIRSVISDMIEILGHEVVAAASGEEGLKLFQSANFDLVVTDLGMPGIGGWDVTRTCKTLRPEVPVVMISGWGNQIDEEMIGQSRLSGVLAKPFEMEKIKTMLEDVLCREDKATKLEAS